MLVVLKTVHLVIFSSLTFAIEYIFLTCFLILPPVKVYEVLPCNFYMFVKQRSWVIS